ncbi:MAG: CHAT domain-containing protein, partial [Bacteroidota bacterium]
YISQNMNNLGLSDKMVTYAEKAAEQYRLMNDGIEEGFALLNAGAGRMAQNDYTSAITIFKRILALWGSEAANIEGVSDIYYNLSLCNAKLEDWSQAIKFGNLAVVYYKNENNPEGIAASYQLAGYSAVQVGDTERASTSFEQALSNLLDNQPIPAAADVPLRLLLPLANLLDDRSQYFELAENYQAALQDYELVFALQDRIRTELNTPASQQYISQELRPVFQRAIHLQYQLFLDTQDESHLWEALILAERSKAFSLLNALERGRIDQPRREVELRREIARLERDDQPVALAKARLELERLQQLNRQDIPEPAKLEPAQLKSYLQVRNCQLFEYALGEEHSYLITVSPAGDIQMSPLALDNNSSTQVAQLREAIKASAYKEVSLNQQQARLDTDYTGASHAMFSKLFPLYAKPEALPAEMLIIPDGYLGFVPFGALLVEAVKPGKVDYQQLPYLQNYSRIGYSYSTQYLLELEQNDRVNKTNNLLAFAPTFKGMGKSSSSRAVNEPQKKRAVRSLPSLLPLRFNGEEVERITQLIPQSTPMIGAEATRINFEDQAVDYNILHLSSHALVDADDPNQSFIAFSQAGDSLVNEDVLYLNDLYTLNLRAELAVLSACETALGQFSPGEGVLSLARAFAQAGTAATLTTLWKVDDEATKDLMIQFYEALYAGKSRTEALASSQEMAVASPTFAHPYFWSATTLYGRSDAIPFGQPTSWWKYALMGVVLLLIVGATVRWLR